MKIDLSEKTLGQLQVEYPEITRNRESIQDWVNTILLHWITMNKTARRIIDEHKIVEMK